MTQRLRLCWLVTSALRVRNPHDAYALHGDFAYPARRSAGRTGRAQYGSASKQCSAASLSTDPVKRQRGINTRRARDDGVNTARRGRGTAAARPSHAAREGFTRALACLHRVLLVLPAGPRVPRLDRGLSSRGRGEPRRVGLSATPSRGREVSIAVLIPPRVPARLALFGLGIPGAGGGGGGGAARGALWCREVVSGCCRRSRSALRLGGKSSKTNNPSYCGSCGGQ